MIPGKSCPFGDPSEVSIPFVHVCLHNPTDTFRSCSDISIERARRVRWNGIRCVSDWEGEGRIVIVASRLSPFDSGFDRVAVKGDLRGGGNGKEIGISIDSLIDRQFSLGHLNLSVRL